MRPRYPDHPQRIIKREPGRVVLQQRIGLPPDFGPSGAVGRDAALVDQRLDLRVGIALPPRPGDTAVDLFKKHAVGAHRAAIKDT